MATKQEIEKYLKENGYTRNDMQKFFDDSAEVNTTVRLIKESGHNWTNLHISQIELLPTLKETTLQKLAEIQEEEKQAEIEKAKKLDEEENYENNFCSIMSSKIENSKPLTEEELKRLAEMSIEDIFSSDLERWHRWVSSIIKLGEKCYCIEWKQGLTEMQENEFPNQPYEVERHEQQITITKVEWLRVDKK